MAKSRLAYKITQFAFRRTLDVCLCTAANNTKQYSLPLTMFNGSSRPLHSNQISFPDE
jgi:hypothetical protein